MPTFIWVIALAGVVTAVIWIFTAVLFRRIVGRDDSSSHDESSEAFRAAGRKQYPERFAAGLRCFDGLPHECLYAVSDDKLSLSAHCIPCPDAKGTILMMHGFHSTPLRDFAYALPFISQLGYNLVLPYQRAHGKSEGEHLSFGIKERHDVLAWIEAIGKRFGAGEDIYLYGISMGGTTVVMGSGLPYPREVRGIIADCGFTSPYEIVCEVMKHSMHLPKYPFIWIFGLLCRLRAGWSLKEYSTITALKSNRTPILFIHGAEDDFVPPGMTEKNYAECVAEKELVSVKGGKHATSYAADSALCEQRISAFLKRHSSHR